MVVADINILNNFNGPDAPDVDVIRSCVHCGFCLSSCPTYRITQRERSSPRGRIWLMKQVSTGKLELLDPIFEEEMSLCLNCRACEAVCPSGVHYGEILEASRAQIESHRRCRPRSERRERPRSTCCSRTCVVSAWPATHSSSTNAQECRARCADRRYSTSSVWPIRNG